MTEEAEPDEDLVYATLRRWSSSGAEARGEFHKALKTGTALDRTEVQERMLELEVAIVEEHGLTLPPATFPWDEFDRRDQLWERQQGPHAGAGEAEPGVAATVAAPRSHLQTVAGLGGVRSLRNGS